MGNKQSKQLSEAQVIQKKYGDKGIRNILSQQNSPYQSLSYRKIFQQCMMRTEKYQKEGHQVIDKYIKKSEQDYQDHISQLRKDGKVQKIERRTRQQFSQNIGIKEQLERYEQIRETMKEDFKISRQKLERSIRDQTQKHYEVDLNAHYPQYHDKTEQEQKELLVDLEQYGKGLIQAEKKARQQRKNNEIYQFNFTQNFQPQFQSLVPTQKCQEMRKAIEAYLNETIQESISKKYICC